ncbi:MAG TPA: glycosyltransferase family 2 protein [Phycisphaerales bacterium]|nr:glycosyltransferase family 2 protein [Phycisphaerales bacterium]
MTDSPVKELTVFFPFYNEEANIESTTLKAVEVLGRLALDYEIILVNDGSSDATAEIADRLASQNEKIRAIHHETNSGYGAALQTGFRNATKNWVFYTDGDGQFDINQIALLLPLAEKYDIVNGYRQDRQDSPIRKLNAACWGCFVRAILRFKARDIDSAFKLYRRAIFDHIDMESTGALIDAEILARANRAGYSLGHIPVKHLPRTAGTQTGSNIKVILRAFKELFELRKDILSTPKRLS